MALTNNMPNTILLDVHSSAKLLEGIVGPGETIYPGAILQVDTLPNGTAGTIINYDFGNYTIGPVLVAIENMSEGKSVADAYVAGEKIYYMHLRSGDLFWGRTIGAAVEVGQGLAAQDLTGKLIALALYAQGSNIGDWNTAIAIVDEADALTTDNRLIKVAVK